MAEKEKAKVTAETRKVIKLGGSLVISIPQTFVDAHHIKEGDDLPVIANHILKIVPMPERE